MTYTIDLIFKKIEFYAKYASISSGIDSYILSGEPTALIPNYHLMKTYKYRSAIPNTLKNMDKGIMGPLP